MVYESSATTPANVTDAVTGILVTYHQAAEPLDNVIDFGIPFFAISLSLNVLLTSMIVIRLVRHMKDIQGAIGPLFKPNRLYGIVITILVESCALYVVSFVLYIGPWGAGDGAQLIFFPILTQVQVRNIRFYVQRDLRDCLTL